MVPGCGRVCCGKEKTNSHCGRRQAPPVSPRHIFWLSRFPANGGCRVFGLRDFAGCDESSDEADDSESSEHADRQGLVAACRSAFGNSSSCTHSIECTDGSGPTDRNGIREDARGSSNTVLRCGRRPRRRPSQSTNAAVAPHARHSSLFLAPAVWGKIPWMEATTNTSPGVWR